MSRQTKPLARRILAKIIDLDAAIGLREINPEGWRNGTLILKAIENELDWLVISGEIVLKKRTPKDYSASSLEDLLQEGV